MNQRAEFPKSTRKRWIAKASLSWMLISLFLASATLAQSLVNDYATQPDLWRPDRTFESQVDTKGDLNLSVPILTVPGRNGLDFDIAFGYRSGITTKQQSSWIGTGWSFDPGSITRDVRIMLQDGVAYNVDYDTSPEVQPDLYYVSLPGSNFTVTRNNEGTGSTTTTPPLGGSYDFFRTAWRPWKIEYQTGYIDHGSHPNISCVCTQVLSVDNPAGAPRDDIKSWVLTDEGGVRYVFAHPTIGSFTGMFSAQSLHSMEFYVNSWRLIAILGRDYAGAIPQSGLDVTKDASGSWIRFEYTEPAKTSYQDLELTGFWAVREASYLSAIETPTHRAEFETVTKETTETWPPKWEGGLSSIHKQLESISLFAKTSDVTTGLVQKVEIDLSDRFDGFDGTRRLALDGIRFFGAGGSVGSAELPGYKMAYYDLENGSLDDYNEDLDDFGYYNSDSNGLINADTLDGATWSLKSIVHPVGFQEVFLYSNDEICYYCADGIIGNTLYPIQYTEFTDLSDEISELVKNMSIYNANNRQGGARVNQIRTYDSENGLLNGTTKYLYSGGRVSGVPSRFLEYEYSSIFFKEENRNTSAVYYNRIKAVNPDGTWQETYYTTDVSHENVVKPRTTFVYQSNSDRIAISGNEDMLWGRPYRVVSNVSKSIEKDMVDNLIQHRLSQSVTVNGKELSQYWHRNGQRQQETIRTYVSGELNEGSYIENSKTYEYDNSTGLKTEEVSRYEGLDDRVVRYTYIHQLPEYSWATDRNILNEVAKFDYSVVATESGLETFHKSAAQTWDLYSNYASDETVIVPHPRTSYTWTAPSFSGTLPVFDAWTSTDAVPSDWVADKTVVDYDVYGNPTLIENAIGTQTKLGYAHNSSLVTSIALTATEQDVFYESFNESLDASWLAVDSGTPGGATFESFGDQLVIEDQGTNRASEFDHLRYNLSTGIEDSVVVEFDITTGQADGRALFLTLGDASWAGSPTGAGTATSLVFTDGTARIFSNRKWRGMGLSTSPGRIYRISAVVDLVNNSIRVSADGIRVYETDGYAEDIEMIKTIAIGIDGSSSMPGTWRVDDLRLLSPVDQVASIEYDPLHLRPTKIVDESNTIVRNAYDLNGRLSGLYSADHSRKSSNLYVMSRAGNADEFDMENPNVVSQTSYSDKIDGAHFRIGNDWDSSGSVEFEVAEGDRTVTKIGGDPNYWSSVSRLTKDKESIAVVDFSVDASVTGVPYIISYYGDDQTFAVRFNGASRKICVSYSNETFPWTWNCWSDFSIENGEWYTAEIRNLQDGSATARIYETKHRSAASSIKSVSGYATNWIPRARSMAKEDVLTVANPYVGGYVEKTEYLDSYSRTFQERSGTSSKGITTVFDYDEMGNVIRKYLPISSDALVFDSKAAVQAFYADKYPGETVWPYEEYRYDSFGRESAKFPVQLGDERVSITTSYSGEPFFTSMSSEPGATVEVVSSTDENGVTQAVVYDALGQAILRRGVLARPSDSTFPENVTLSASRVNFEEDDGGIFPNVVDLNDWQTQYYSYVPSQSYLVSFDIELDVEGTGQANVVLQQNGSTIKIWVFDNSSAPTIYRGAIPVLSGQGYEFIVSAGVSDSEEYPGSASAILQLRFSENGEYLAFHETQFTFDPNGNNTRVVLPTCFENSVSCDEDAGAWVVQKKYDTASRLIAESNPDTDGDGDGDPANETVSNDPDFEYRLTSTGMIRFAEDPTRKNTPSEKFLITDYDAFSRQVESGVYRGKRKFTTANVDNPIAGLVDTRSLTSYLGGNISSASYDSTMYRYGYDRDGNVAEILIQILGLDPKIVQYGYDQLGNLVWISYQHDTPEESFFTWYEYDASGVVDGVFTNDVDDRESAVNDVSYDYDYANTPVALALGSAAERLEYKYDIRGFLTNINDINDAESGVFAEAIGYETPDEIGLSGQQNVGFQPNNNGIKSWVAWRTDGNIDKGTVGGYTYEYDKLYRLTRADFGKRFALNSGWSASSSFDVNAGITDNPITYDGAGNVVSVTRTTGTGSGQPTSYAYQAGSNLVENVTGGIDRLYGYDANGNVLTPAGDETLAAYDELNHLSTLAIDGSQFKYRYDVSGNRVYKSTDDEAFYIRGQDGTVIAVYDQDGSLRRWNIVVSGKVIGYAVP